jgi:hypothetical protein
MLLLALEVHQGAWVGAIGEDEMGKVGRMVPVAAPRRVRVFFLNSFASLSPRFVRLQLLTHHVVIFVFNSVHATFLSPFF